MSVGAFATEAYGIMQKKHAIKTITWFKLKAPGILRGPQRQFNVNTTTKYLYTELDASFTLIYVPQQKMKKITSFIFQIDGKHDLKLN